MSDAELRHVEARYRETGAIEDEVAYLRARVRVGELELDRLRVAALIGSASACEVLGASAPSFEAEDFFEALCVDVEVGVRAALSLYRYSMGLLREQALAPQIEASARPAVLAAQAWAGCPCPQHALEAARVAGQIGAHADAAAAAAEATAAGHWSYQAVQAAHYVPGAIAVAAGLPEPYPADAYGTDPSELLVAACVEFAVMPSHVERSLDQARATLSDDLVPWLLGLSDPLAD